VKEDNYLAPTGADAERAPKPNGGQVEKAVKRLVVKVINEEED
jgi:hypothetical protein